MVLVQDDDVIQAFSPDRSDDSFGVGVLPRRSWRGQDLADVHGSQTIAEGYSIGAIAIPDEVSRGAVPCASVICRASQAAVGCCVTLK